MCVSYVEITLDKESGVFTVRAYDDLGDRQSLPAFGIPAIGATGPVREIAEWLEQARYTEEGGR